MNAPPPKRPRRANLVAAAPPATNIAPLDPHTLGQIAEDAMRALLVEGESENTIRSYQSALRYWAAWFGLRFGQAISVPVPVPAVIQFIVDHAQRKTADGLESELPQSIDQALVAGGYKAGLGPPALATLAHRVSVLSKVHQLKALPNPCRDPKVRELLAKTRRAYAKRGVVQDKKAALTREPLEALLDTCDDSLRGARDRALLLFAWASGGRRRSEVTAATTDNVRKIAREYSPGHSSVVLLGLFRYSRLTHYICGHCGYHESYVEIPEDLQAVIDCSERVAVTAKKPLAE